MEQSHKYPTTILSTVTRHIRIRDRGETNVKFLISILSIFSNRGQCYFFGQYSNITFMWQTVNLINYVGPLLIEGQIVQFNLSTWLGGY
jgi:hypothetical protein